jgi:putative ABC transport system permease protein
VQNVRLLSDIVDEALGPMRLAVWLMTGFGAIALTLAAVGIYGVFSYFVGERTREIAVRLALGATPSDIRGLVVRRGVRLLALGLGIGLTGAIAITTASASLLYEVRAFDVPTYLVAVVCLAGVAIAACWLPARRASRVDPQLGLRQA